MKGIWKKLYQKTAVGLVASMLVTSVVPIAGLAAVYGVNGIYSDESDYDLSEYKATASVAAKVIAGVNEIELTDGVGEAEIEAEYDITVKLATESNASDSNATASNADWSDIKSYIEEEVLKNLSMEAIVLEPDSAIAQYVTLDTAELNADGIVTAKVKVPADDRPALADGTYWFTVRFSPVLDEDALADNIVIDSIKSSDYAISVKVEGGELKAGTINLNGFNGEMDNADGVTTTWRYLEYGDVFLKNYCTNVPEDATITFTSSDETVAMIDGSYFIPVGTGKTTITATMTAPGYQTATDTLIVEVWKFEPQNNLPEMITVDEGETWTRTFAEPLRSDTKFFVYNDITGHEAEGDAVKVSISEDMRTITVEAKRAGRYSLYYRCHDGDSYTTYDEEMRIIVLAAGVSLKVSTDQIVVEPGESVTFDVEYSPVSAKLVFDYDNKYIKVDSENGKVTVTGLSLDTNFRGLYVILKNADEVLAEKYINVYVVEKQLEAGTAGEALAEANSKIQEIIENGDEAALYKLVDEVVKILAKTSQSELAANKAAIDELEEALSDVADIDTEVHGDVETEASGALLNLLSMGETDGKLVVKPIEDAANTAGVTLDIKFQRGSNGENITELNVPMQLRVKVSGIDLTKQIRIRHTKENGSAEWIYPTVKEGYLVFWVKSYSTFAISNYSPGSGGSGGSGGGGGSAGKTTATGTVYSDAKKGYVNTLTGIITGSGAGYSQWNQDEAGWKLQYADGTFAAGTMVTDENGNTHEQVAWELINGAWYSFGANGYVSSGLVYDVALGGTFYVDINSGMKTGWQMIDGVWRYFNTVSDGRRGVMLTDTTVDGYYIDAEGIWRG